MDLVQILEGENLKTIPLKTPIPGTPSVPIFVGNFTPKTSNYCHKNRALGFPGI